MTRHIFKSKDSKVTLSVDQSLFGDSSPNTGQLAIQWLKAITAVAVLMFILWPVVGTPYLRWDEPLIDGKDGTDLQEENLAFTRYISIGDRRQVYAGEYGPGLPWLIFIPLDDEADVERSDRFQAEATDASF